jgi:ATP-dependent Clp protease ATP-binding subunit ClpA
VRNVVTSELKRHLPPEFLNRLDDVIVFEPLTPEDMRAITGKLLMRERATAQVRGFELRWDDAVVEWMATKGYTPFDGARPIRTLVQQRIQDEAAQQVLDGRLKAGQTIVAEVVDGELRLTGVDPAPDASGPDAASPAAPLEPEPAEV